MHSLKVANMRLYQKKNPYIPSQAESQIAKLFPILVFLNIVILESVLSTMCVLNFTF